MTSIVKSLYLISGIYDLSEARYVPTVNPNNILSLNDSNAVALSPIHFNFNRWVTAQSDYIIPAIYFYVAANDPPKLIEQSHFMNEMLTTQYHLSKCRFILMNNYDHFDIVEELSKSEYIITRTIIDETKFF